MERKKEMAGIRGSSLLQLAAAMVIYGTLGVVRRYLPLPSGLIAMVRGFIGAAFLMSMMAFRRRTPDWKAIRRNLGWLVFSGVILGLGWVVLFETYRYTSVATATLCYYMAPIMVIVVSAVLYHETVGPWRSLCVLTALVGMVFASGVAQTKFTGFGELRGIMLGLFAAALYAAMILLNMNLCQVPAYERAIVQLFTAGMVLLPYNLVTVEWSTLQFGGTVIPLLLVIGIIHTGVAYAFYFGSMTSLSTHTVAIMSYIDPVVAVVLSAVFLQESIGTTGIVGAVLVLGSTVASEVVK